MKPILYVACAIVLSTTLAHAVRPEFGYDFLAGDNNMPMPNADWQSSTSNDAQWGCHFSTPTSMQTVIDSINASNKITINFTYLWKTNPLCTFSSGNTYVDANTFNTRVAPYLSVLNSTSNKNRLYAIYLFDEPDLSSHGGPSDAALQNAVNYLHTNLTGIPVFIVWFTASNNTRVPNVDWYSTTKGWSSFSTMKTLGKPMVLWWFDNQANPAANDVDGRWTTYVNYFYSNASPRIASLSWCCDNLELWNSPDPLINNNSTELDALLANIGKARHDTGKVFRSSYTRPPNSSTWFAFRRNSDSTLSYTNVSNYPNYPLVPNGGLSPFYPAVLGESGGTSGKIRLVVTGVDSKIYQALYDVGLGSWNGWTDIGGLSNEKPDLFLFNNTKFLAVRGIDNGVWVRRLDVDANYTNLGGIATSAPYFKTVNNQLRVAVYGNDSQTVYSRTWNGSTWSQWVVDP